MILSFTGHTALFRRSALVRRLIMLLIFSLQRGAKQSNYKHVPHKDKPKHLVDKRNARERNRVKQVNDAFSMLRRYIPIENKNKRVSKVSAVF